MTNSFNYQHLVRTGAVVIKKPKLRMFNMYTAYVAFLRLQQSQTSLTWETFKKNLINDEKLRLNDMLKSGILVEGATSSTYEDPYWYIVSTIQDIQDKTVSKYISSPVNKSNVDSSDSLMYQINSPTNGRVISANVTQNTSGPGIASIVIDNTDDLFYLKDVTPDNKSVIFQQRECIFESNDIVKVYLPDWEGNLHCSFTGYINEVQDENDGLNKRITLQCEDVLKQLSLSRTNANPSLDPDETEGQEASIFTVSYADKSPEAVITSILARNFCNLFSDKFMITELQSIYKVQKTTKRSIGDMFKEVNKVLDNYTSKYVDTIKGSDGKTIEKIIGYRVGVDSTGLPYKRDVAFVVHGMNQSLWGWQTNGNYDVLISDWKSNDEVIKSIASRAFFEFFADQDGVVRVRPKNLVLPKINSTMSQLMKSRIKNNYWIVQDKEVYLKSFTKSTDDRYLYTDVVINGAFVAGNTTNPLLRKLVIGSFKNRVQYGVRMLPTEVRPGITEPSPMDILGRLRIARQNAEFTKASAIFEGNSCLTQGNPIFFESLGSVYYIDAVSHSFMAGQGFTTTLTLSFKRKPFSFTTDYLSRTNDLVGDGYMGTWERDSIKADIHGLTWGKYTLYTATGQANPSIKDKSIVWENIPVDMITGKLQVESDLAEEQLFILSEQEKCYLKDVLSSINSNTKKLSLEDYDKAVGNLKKTPFFLSKTGEYSTTVYNDSGPRLNPTKPNFDLRIKDK